jgi:hypothetical protein
VGTINGLPINEGVALLYALEPSRLTTLEKRFPHLPLALGIQAGGGDTDEPDEYILDKAAFMIVALDQAAESAEEGRGRIARLIRKARLGRTISQGMIIVGSSASLATLALSQTRAAILSSLLSLLAAIGNLAAEHRERLLIKDAGSIYDAYEKLSISCYRAKLLSGEIQLALKHRVSASEIRSLVTNGNVLCEEMNGWLVQLVETVNSRSGR